MTTRMTPLSNPRLLIVFIVLPLIVAAGIAMIPLLGLLYGLAAVVVAALIAWTLLKLVRRQMRTRIRVDDDGIQFTLYGDEILSFPWSEVRLAGLAVEPGRRGRRTRRLFVYQEQKDRLMAVPEEFLQFDELVAAVRERAVAFHDVTLAADETLKDRLRLLLEQG